jgi:menaquinone-dependent protoporphyrinogen IX oxidase
MRMAGKTLVAYRTKGGASETYAKTIAETLASKGLHADLVNLNEKVPVAADYDNVVVGTGVRMLMVYGRWKKVLKQKALKEKRLFMFLSSGTAIEKPDEAVEKYVKPIVEKYNLKPISIGSFPGAIPDKWKDEKTKGETVKPEKAKAWAEEIAGKMNI